MALTDTKGKDKGVNSYMCP